MFAYIWTYVVKPEAIDPFEQAYGPEGTWVRLFRLHPGYLRTELLRDASSPGRYCTIDYWRSQEERDDFRLRFAAEFATLDAACDALTVREDALGDFVTVP